MSEPTGEMSELFVAVIGNGIAGSACAAALARRGLRVTLHGVETPPDRKLARPNLVSPPLTSDARAELERFELADALPVGPALPGAYSISVPGVPPIEAAFEDPLGTVPVDRLTTGLRTHAATLGAEMAESPAIDVRRVNDSWIVEDATGEWKTSHAVFALEPVHPWAERFGVQPDTIGEIEIVEVAADRGSRDDRLEIELGALPRGYFWTAPIAGRVFAGLNSPTLRTPRASRMLHAFLTRHAMGDRGILARHRAAVSSVADGPVVVAPNGLWIGSGASWADPVTGARLGGALKTARWAAMRIADDDLHSAATKARRSVAREREAATRVADVLYSQPARFIEAVHAEPDMFAEISARLIGLESYASLFGRLRSTKVQRFLSRIHAGS